MSMSIKSFLAVGQLLPSTESIMLRGETGIGKSSVIKKLAKTIQENEKLSEYPVIDRRFSQMSEGDVVGLPSTDGDVTRFNPPDWYKKACLQPCMLFLDEINRATPEVMQAAFQIALDRELNGHKLHPQTRVATAVNIGGAYTVNEMDPALLDRFFVVDLNPTTEDWMVWARDPEGGNIIEQITDFHAHSDKFLDPPKKIEPNSKTPTRRTWEKLSRSMRAAGIAEKHDHDSFYTMCLGFLGAETSIAFHSFVKDNDSRITGEEIINSYSKVKAKVKKGGNERKNSLIEKVSDYVNANLDELNEQQQKNLKEFTKELPGELVVSLWSKLTAQGIDKTDLCVSVYQAIMPLVLDVFGMKPGEEGLNMTPNIPQIFQQNNGK